MQESANPPQSIPAFPVAAPFLAAMKTETDSNILFHARGILSAVGWRPAPTMKEGG